MNQQDLKDKCSRAMLESGQDVKVKLTIPAPATMEDGANVVGLGLRASGGPMALVIGRATIDGKEMLDVHVKASELLKALR